MPKLTDSFVHEENHHGVAEAAYRAQPRHKKHRDHNSTLLVTAQLLGQTDRPSERGRISVTHDGDAVFPGVPSRIR
ncbi:MAG: hypothetical protein J7M39_11615 [Anaerolineae bacterium]|nr:hypothetical protein [Anaerolineae bacterium]